MSIEKSFLSPVQSSLQSKAQKQFVPLGGCTKKAARSIPSRPIAKGKNKLGIQTPLIHSVRSFSDMAPFPRLLLVASLLLFSALSTPATASSSNTTSRGSILKKTTMMTSLICQSTPYPNSCLESVKLSISITINPSILSYALQLLQTAISDASKLSSVLSAAHGPSGIVEKQRGAIQDCQELHQITLSALQYSASLVRSNNPRLPEVRTYLSAALTNKNTCLEGLAGSSGPLMTTLPGSLTAVYQQVSNSLSLVSGSGAPRRQGRRLYGAGFPRWLHRRDRRLLQSVDYGGFDPGSVLTVAADGSGNFTTIGDAIGFAPNNSAERTIIIVREGLYEEHVDIPAYKTNIVLLGDGSDVTVIRGNRSVGDGWTTFRSATVAVSGQGFLARDVAIENVAGAAKAQAVALRVNADFSAVYRCTLDAYQDTLYPHSFRQFYRECDIYGTIDFIFGNAAVIFQACNLVVKKPLPNQYNVVTAQSRDDPNEATGISIQNCSVLPSDDLASSTAGTRTYLGRPWRLYSRTVYIESYIDGLIDPAGWMEWSPDQGGLDKLYYGEYSNTGPGSGTTGRVTWPGYHLMDYDDASNFTVSDFISGDDWLDSTSFPYDDGV